MRNKILVLLLILVMALPLLLAACGGLPTGTTDDDTAGTYTKNQLQILRSDLKLTQEQSLSRIKAEYLLKNNGYSDSDSIVAIITLPGKSVIDGYLDDAGDAADVADYAKTAAGEKILREANAEQDAMIARLTEAGLISGVIYRYTTITNAIAVNTTYGSFRKIGGVSGVSNTILSETYNRPQSVEGTDASAIVNPVDVYPTGIFNSASAVSASGERFTGKHTAVAILDSGFDCEHTVFSVMPSGELLITPQEVSAILGGTTAKALCPSLELLDVYYNNKIPFIFDYADKDKNVNPYDSEHGTHVAGIIGGSDDVITGVAVDTQLVLMKVFPDLDEGGRTEDILAALEDAVLLKVDAINMSLGSSCGFSREVDGDAINAVYDKINESGISLITAASNSYSSAYGGEQGNTARVTNPDTATVGSPSTYPAALSVASISGTKSRYMVGNGAQIIFFNESNKISGKPNDFFSELGIGEGQSKTFEYVTIPGVGLKANYAAFEEGYLKGKIALVRRGDNTFEDKALQAKNAGAVACIIYNNVEGDILMSMGKSDHIPTISISKEDGTQLAEKAEGTLTIEYKNQAGPFMSDFSSWGPTPDLKLKPEITAHGGNIKSSVPGGGYDELSGTSMATPNLCGIVVLIRQYLKEKYPDYSYKQISVMTNQMLMSTATIIRNEEGNPYSPRKQGAGLASLSNVVNTPAYLTVDGIDRTKLELGDDPTRLGVYTMSFNVINISESAAVYDLSLVAMTETVSRSDSDYIAEKDRILGGGASFTVTGGTLSGSRLTVPAGEAVRVTAVYTMSESDKAAITSAFPYGMYVEGFVKLTKTAKDGVDLNVPFLAFFGDWTEAPMFDKTYYEVESEAHNAAIDDEDKLKADYYATTPYGSYYYNYIIPLGTYLYDIDTSAYDAIPASESHIALSDSLGTIDGLSAVYAGLLRNAKTMDYSIVDKVTGETVWSLRVDNAKKAYSNGASPVPNYEYLRLKSAELGLVNNRRYTFTMKGKLDYGDGGVDTNARNSFSFDFCLDNEAPVVKSVSYEKVYDRTQKKDRYYITMTVWDNHYTQSITPVIFTSSSSYAFLTDNPIPVYSERNSDTTVRFEITDYLDSIYSDEIICNALAFSVDDYALNSNIYICQLPGTKGDFKFTKDGSEGGTDLRILSIYEDEVVDLTQYLWSSDKTLDADKDYLRYLDWSTSNEKVATVRDGQVVGIKAGRTTITVREEMNGKQANLIINVKSKSTAALASDTAILSHRPGKGTRTMSRDSGQSASGDRLSEVRFTYFDTVFAYSRAAQTSKIGQAGDRTYISSLDGGISFYPGEQILLHYELEPWYVADRYSVKFSSTNPSVASVDETGKVTALKKGTASITLKVDGSNLIASVKVTVNSEFIIENRTLVAYKGLGGDIVIPNDEGILYIGAYAFCLYDTDRSIELTEDDYDANKIPAANTTIRSVVIPDTVEEIQKYAFYNCSGLVSVTIPSTVKIIREFAFAKDARLSGIDLSHVEVIGREAFGGCSSLETADLRGTYSIGVRAFNECTSLKSVDLTDLRNAGEGAFRMCTSLREVVFGRRTRLAESMFAMSGIASVTLYETIEIPKYCFASCPDLTEVTIAGDGLWRIGYGAFCESGMLSSVTFECSVDIIDEQAFYACTALGEITLPDCPVSIGRYVFFMCDSLRKVTLGDGTKITVSGVNPFAVTSVTEFSVGTGNNNYSVTPDGHFLLSKDGKTLVLAATGADYTSPVSLGYEVIGPAAFGGTNVTDVRLTYPGVVIGDYAFAGCLSLVNIALPESTASIGAHAFNGTKALRTVGGLDKCPLVGDYAFSGSGIESVMLADRGVYGEGAFFSSSLRNVTIGAGSRFGLGAFQSCSHLEKVVMPGEGGIHFGLACFAYDISLSDIDLSKLDDTIEEQTFYGCTSLRAANLLTVKKIGAYAFADCSALIRLDIPIVEEIGMGAFSRYDTKGGAPIFSGTGDSQVFILPATLRVLGDGAFLGCEGLVEVDLSAVKSLTGISEDGEDGGFNYLFAYCIKLESVALPDCLKRVGKYAFAGCELLDEINLSGVSDIADYAFTSCASLKSVKLNSARKIGTAAFANTALTGSISAPYLSYTGSYAFQNAKLTSFSAPTLSYIGEAAFMNNSLLTGFTFSDKLARVEPIAFLGCKSLNAFTRYNENGGLTEDGEINDYARLIDGVLYTTLPSGALELHSLPAGKFNIKDGKKSLTLEVPEGTVRIDLYAGNGNQFLTKLILPSSLLAIGNYAFYGCDALTAVEFRSFAAPALESHYAKAANLSESDPGYELLHNQFDLFELELCYYNFIDLVGKKNPIKMILPKNTDLKGYDSLVYLAYFGEVAAAERSDLEAMDENMQTFISEAEKIAAIAKITLADEELINRAVSAMNAAKQDYTLFGITKEEWDGMVKTVTDAKATLSALKFERAGEELKALQARINALPDSYTAELRTEISEIANAIASLTAANRNLLDLSRYNALRPAYDADINSDTPLPPEEPGKPDEQGGLPVYAIILIVFSGAAVAAGVALGVAITVSKKRGNKKGSAPADNKDNGKNDNEKEDKE